MRAIVQRVTEATVRVGERQVAGIGPGLVVLLGVHRADSPAHADKMALKLRSLRVFEDHDGKLNRSVADMDGEVLVVSQFTVLGDARRGNRPSFAEAAAPEVARPLYEQVREALGARGGSFGEHMRVSLVNDGPVTILIDL